MSQVKLPPHYSEGQLTDEQLLRLGMLAHPLAMRKALEGDKCLTPDYLWTLSDKILTRLMTERGLRLIVNIPPRHGKSDLMSLWTPTWYLENLPDHRVGLAAYGSDFAKEWSMKVRDNFFEYEGILQTRINEKYAAADAWMTTAGGGMWSAGVDGPFTGRGFNLLIVDDPIKNNEDAESPTIREKVWGWWRTTARLRLQSGGNILVLMTRWVEDDLAGRLIDQMERAIASGKKHYEKWEVYKYPAIAEGLGVDEKGEPRRDAIGRKDGDILAPEFFTADEMEILRESSGSRVWSALYQQEPVPQDGSMFKREYLEPYRYRIIEENNEQTICLTFPSGSEERHPVSECTTFLVADTAMKAKKSNDASCVMVWWMTPNRRMILKDMWHGREQAPDVEKRLRQMYFKHNCMFLGVEDKGGGTVAIQNFMSEGTISVKPLKATGSKEDRARVLAAMMESGRVWWPHDLHYWLDVEKEILKFPFGAHDDIVDTAVYAARVLSARTYDSSEKIVVVDTTGGEYETW